MAMPPRGAGTRSVLGVLLALGVLLLSFVAFAPAGAVDRIASTPAAAFYGSPSTHSVRTTSLLAGAPYRVAGSNSVLPSLKVSGCPPECAVVFVETGLSNGTSWSATVDGNTSTEYSTTNSIVFPEPNGTYKFSIASLAGYVVSPSSGYIIVNGAVAYRAVSFTAVPTLLGLTVAEAIALFGGLLIGLVIGIVVTIVLRGAGKPPPATPNVPSAPGGTPPGRP
jgi:hypothetical protein